MIRLGFIGALGVCLDAALWSATGAFWREVVHKTVLEQKVDAGWAANITWTLIDGAFAVLIMVGIGVVGAAALVSFVAGLARR